MEPAKLRIVIATWGEAQLLRRFDMSYELEGGTAEERKEAMEWIEKYLPSVREELRGRSME